MGVGVCARLALRHTGVVELSGLANGKAATANDKDLLDVDVLLGFYHSACEVRLRIGSFLRNAGGVGAGSREEAFLAQPGAGEVGRCAEEAGLRAGGQRPQLGEGDWDAATMTEDGRGAARLGHGRQHCAERGVRSSERGQSGTGFRISGGAPIPRGRQLASVAGRPSPRAGWGVAQWWGGKQDRVRSRWDCDKVGSRNALAKKKIGRGGER